MRWHTAPPHLADWTSERINMDAILALRVEPTTWVPTRFHVIATTIAGVEVELFVGSATMADENRDECARWMRRLVELYS